MSVLVMGNIEVYERDGVYQIIATEIAPLGVGVMHVQLEQTKKKLEKMGVFDVNKKENTPCSKEDSCCYVAYCGGFAGYNPYS